jgi:hypothetical protein
MGKNWPKFAKFLIFKLLVSYEAFLKVAKNIEGLCSFYVKSYKVLLKRKTHHRLGKCMTE